MVKKNKGRRNRHATRNNNNNHTLKGVNNETVKINTNNNSSDNTSNTTVESSIDTIQRDNNIRTLDSTSNPSTTANNPDNNVSNLVHQKAGQEEVVVDNSLASLVNNSSNLGATLVNPQNITEQTESEDSNSDINSDTINVTDDTAENVDFSTFDDSNTMLVDNNDSGAVKILDNIVTYEMVGWWNDAEDKPYNRLRLHQKPPVIKFKQHVTGDIDGDNDTKVSIVVTRQLASQLATLFNMVQDSYDGKPVSDKHKRVKNWDYFVEYWKQMWKYNPVKVVFGTILTLVVLGSLIYVSVH